MFASLLVTVDMQSRLSCDVSDSHHLGVVITDLEKVHELQCHLQEFIKSPLPHCDETTLL